MIGRWADAELHAGAAGAMRSLVGEVMLTPGEKRGAMQAVLRGKLMVHSRLRIGTPETT